MSALRESFTVPGTSSIARVRDASDRFLSAERYSCRPGPNLYGRHAQCPGGVRRVTGHSLRPVKLLSERGEQETATNVGWSRPRPRRRDSLLHSPSGLHPIFRARCCPRAGTGRGASNSGGSESSSGTERDQAVDP
jgi:hypothetical protein